MRLNADRASPWGVVTKSALTRLNPSTRIFKRSDLEVANFGNASCLRSRGRHNVWRTWRAYRKRSHHLGPFPSGIGDIASMMNCLCSKSVMYYWSCLLLLPFLKKIYHRSSAATTTAMLTTTTASTERAPKPPNTAPTAATIGTSASTPARHDPDWRQVYCWTIASPGNHMAYLVCTEATGTLQLLMLLSCHRAV